MSSDGYCEHRKGGRFYVLNLRHEDPKCESKQLCGATSQMEDSGINRIGLGLESLLKTKATALGHSSQEFLTPL